MSTPVRDEPGLWWDEEPPPVKRGPRLRTWVISLVAAAALGSGIGALSLDGGSGGVPRADQIPDIPQSSVGASPQAGAPVTQPRVTSFDPVSGGSGFASPGAAGAPAATYVTQHYRSAAFSGLKPGIGLVADFGRPVVISRVSFTAAVADTSVQVLAGDQPPTGDSPLAPASATLTPAGATTIPTNTETPHRYWMLWCTRLGSDGKGGWWAAFTQPTFTG